MQEGVSDHESEKTGRNGVGSKARFMSHLLRTSRTERCGPLSRGKMGRRDTKMEPYFDTKKLHSSLALRDALGGTSCGGGCITMLLKRRFYEHF